MPIVWIEESVVLAIHEEQLAEHCALLARLLSCHFLDAKKF